MRNQKPVIKDRLPATNYQEILIKVATPTSVGMGFLLPKWKVIVTCEHIVRGNEEVVVQGLNEKSKI